MKKLLTYIMLMQVALAFSQKQGNVWYFGINAGIDFNTTPPTALLDGQINSYEAAASIADADGNLLFYTEGLKVYNKNHQTMQNGNGLLGNISTSQIIIIPKPGSETIYYIFTIAAGENPVAGFTYSEVDMTLDNGLGAVTQNKNIQLLTDTSEHLTAAFHRNGTDIWVLTRGLTDGLLYSFLVTPNGVPTTPVTSFLLGGASYGGYMKVSPDGSKLAHAGTFFATLSDFDNSTGQASNGILLNEEFINYGIEFSPSGKRLYVSGYMLAQVWQYNLEAENIPASEVLVLDDGIDYYGGTLQRAANGKIYMSNYYETSISVIDSPDALGTACNIIPHAVDLGGRTAWLGLPFVIFPSPLTIEARSLCDGTSATFSFTTDVDYDSVAWDFGDGTTSAELNPTHAYAAGGTYTVTFTATRPGEERVVTQQVIIAAPPQFILPETYTACIASAITIETEAQNFNPANATYAWTYNGQPIGGNDASLVATGFGEYTVTVTVGECTTTKTTTVVQQELSITFTEGCQEGDYILSAYLEEGVEESTAVFSWEGPGGFTAGQQHITITQPGPYFVTITTQQGCTVQQTYEVIDANCETPFIPKGISPNSDGFNDEFDLTGLNVKHLSIFNRYGKEVYTYNNYTAQWYGQTTNGDQLPDGTYYFLINKEDGLSKTGWVYINR